MVCVLAAMAIASPAGAAVSPGAGVSDTASASKKKKCKKKGKKATASAKKKCKKKKKRTGPPVLRASLVWSLPQVNVDLVAVDSEGNALPIEAFFGSPASRPLPIPNALWSGDVAGGPETFTDLELPYDRPFRFFACVNPRPVPITLTISIYDPGSAAARVATVTVPPGGEPAPINFGVSPADGPVLLVPFICEQRQI
jgi:hypothetical protein